MAKPIENEKKVYPQDAMDKKLLFASIKRFKPSGVNLGVENVSKPYRTSFGKVQVAVKTCITEDEGVMESLQYVLDENEQYVMITDEFGDEKPKTHVVDGHLAMATLFLNVNCEDTDVTEESELTIYPTSGSYPLFKSALMQNGDLPEDMGNKAFVTDGKELKEALEGFEFVGVVKKSTGKYKFEYLGVL